MLKPALTAIAIATIALSGSPASATGLQDDIAKCRAAAVERGITTDKSARGKLLRANGASLQKLAIRLLPKKGGKPVTIECQIRRGEIVALNELEK